MTFDPRHYLTRQQRNVLCVALLLLVTGLAVKAWRLSHPAAHATEAKPN